MSVPDISRAVLRAVRLIEAHDSVVSVEVNEVKDSGVVVADVMMKTELPNSWRAAGSSPSGVRAIEPISFRFGPNYPVSAPSIRLRPDFDRSHPHLQPGDADELPEPCLIAGSPRELLRSRGILGLVEQLAEWLERAALVQLIDPEQGWEPTRRDHIADIIIAERAWLTGLPTRIGGCEAFRFRYFASLKYEDTVYWAQLKRSKPVAIAADLTATFKYRERNGYRIGDGFALVAWSGRKPDGTSFIADRYRPETVSTLDQLLARAEELGMREYLEPKLTLLQSRFGGTDMKVPVPLGVLLLARRPYPVIGTDSPVEICPYTIELLGNDALSSGGAKIVRPSSHREDIAVSLLRRASDDDDSSTNKWTLLGCGSVGSKIALHLARAGRGPSDLVDSANVQPHNYARHALYPDETGSDSDLAMPKSLALNDVLTRLKQPAIAHTADIVAHLMREKSLTPLTRSDTFALVNTTGSASVREALSSPTLTGERPRVIESCLLGLGRVAMMAVEGSAANPSTVDLITEAYCTIHAKRELRPMVFGRVPTEIAIGQGCSAMTLPLSDTRVSMFSAAMADRLADLQRNGLPDDGGRLIVGTLKDDDLSVDWTQEAVPPRILVGGGPMQIRISPVVDAKIAAEIARRSGSETGGILFGRYCDITETFHVVGTLPAPPDSKFSAEEFVLGMEGLRPMLADLIEGSGGALYPLGTWHNHLITSGASAKDMGTAVLLSGMQFFPLLMLIHTPDGYTFLVVETVADMETFGTSADGAAESAA